MRRLKYAVLTTVAVMGLASVAYADGADRARRAAPVAVSAPSWTGFYVGVNAGGAWAHSDFTSNLIPGPAFPGSGAIFGAASNIALVSSLGTGGVQGQGKFTGGGQFGYNWQAAPGWIAGFEVDFNSFRQNLSLSQAGVTTIGPAAITSSMSTNWLATFRARVGATFDRSLLYVTGGLALTDLHYSQVYTDTSAPFPDAGSSASTATKVGLTVGGGGEFMLVDRWTVKAEYLYVQFDPQTANALLCQVGGGGCSTFSQNLQGSTGLVKAHIARLGLNYRF